MLLFENFCQMILLYFYIGKLNKYVENNFSLEILTFNILTFLRLQNLMKILILFLLFLGLIKHTLVTPLIQ